MKERVLETQVGLLPAFLLLVLVVFPFLGFLHVLGELEAKSHQTREESQKKELEVVVSATSRKSRADSRCEDFARQLISRWKWGGRLPALFRLLPQGCLSVYFFGPAGNRLELDGIPTTRKLASERFMRLLKQRRENLDKPFGPGEDSFLKSFCGSSEKVLFMAKSPGRVLDFAELGLLGLGGWFPLPPQKLGRGERAKALPAGDMIFLLDLNLLPRDLFTNESVVRQQKLVDKEIRLGWVDLENPGILHGKFPSGITPSMKKWLGEVHSGEENRVDGCWVRFFDLPSRLRIFGFRPVRDRRPGDYLPRTLVAFSGLLLVLGLLARWRWGKPLRLPIRSQLMGIFLLAGGVSCAGLFAFGTSYVDSRRDAIVRQCHERALQILQKVDDQFLPSLKPREEELRRSMKQAMGSSDPDYLKVFRSGLEHEEFYIACLAGEGKDLWDAVFHEKESSGSIPRKYFKNVFQSLGSNLLAYHFKGLEGIPPSNPMTDALLSAPFVLETFFRMMGRIGTYNFLNHPGLVFVDFIRTRSGTPRGVLFLTFDSIMLEADFLKRARRRLARNSPFRLGAAPKSRSSPLGNIPGRAGENALFSELLEQTRQTGSPRSLIGTLKGRSVLATVAPGTRLLDFHLFLFTPFSVHESELSDLERRFRFLSILTMVFMIALGLIFSQSLLDPLQNLSAGLESLTCLRLKDRISFRSGDELEEVAGGLNGVLADLEEIQAASAVQKELLPGRVISVGQFRARGFHRGVEPIAGSFFMVVPIPGGGIGFLAGEIRHSGILRGLLLAMYMTTFRLLFERCPGLPPGEILRRGMDFLRLDLGQGPKDFRPREEPGQEPPGNPATQGRQGHEVALLLGIWDPDLVGVRFHAVGNWLLACLCGGTSPELLDLGASPAPSEEPGKEFRMGFPKGGRILIGTPGLHSEFFAPDPRSPRGRFWDLLERLGKTPLDQVGEEIFQEADRGLSGNHGIGEQVILCIDRESDRGTATPGGGGDPL